MPTVGGEAAHIKHQGRARLATGVGHRGAIQHRGAWDVREAARQPVEHRDLARVGARGQLHGDGVAHRVANFGDGLVAGLRQRDGRGCQGIDRNMVVDDAGATRPGDQAQVVERGRADCARGCGGLRLNGQCGAQASGWVEGTCSRRNDGRHEGVAGRWFDRDGIGAQRRCRRCEEELVQAFTAHGHRNRVAIDGVAARTSAQDAQCWVPARAGSDGSQGDHGAGHGLAHQGVIHNTARIDRQALLNEFLPGRQHHAQNWVCAGTACARASRIDGSPALLHAAHAGGAWAVFAIHRQAEQSSRHRIAKAHFVGYIGRQVGNAVLAIGTGHGLAQHSLRVGVNDLNDPTRQALVCAVEHAQGVADVVPRRARDRRTKLHRQLHGVLASVVGNRRHTAGQGGAVTVESGALGGAGAARFDLTTALDHHRIDQRGGVERGAWHIHAHGDGVGTGSAGIDDACTGAAKTAATRRARATPPLAARGFGQRQTVWQAVAHGVGAGGGQLAHVAHADGGRHSVVDR